MILDDKNALRIALEIGLKVIGTAGMLLRAKKKGALAEVKPLLNALEKADFRLSKAIVQKTLQLAGEY